MTAKERKEIFIDLKPPQCFSHSQPKPIYHRDKQTNEEFFLFACNSAACDSCYKYSITHKRYSYFAKYPKSLMVANHGHVIDKENNKYYIFGGRRNILAEFDLNHLCSSNNDDKYWTVHPQDTIENFIGVAGVCINDKLQIFAPTHAVSVDLQLEEKIFVDMDAEYDKWNPYQYGNNICFSPKLNKLCIIYGKKMSIFSILDFGKPVDKDTMQKTVIDLPFEAFEVSLQFGSNSGNICGFSSDGNILVLICVKRNKAWSMDIGQENEKWMMTEFVYPKPTEEWFSLRMGIGSRNDAYLFNTYPKEGVYLIKVSLNDLIPKEILNRYNDKLVYGFVRESDAIIPPEIVKLLIIFCM